MLGLIAPKDPVPLTVAHHKYQAEVIQLATALKRVLRGIPPDVVIAIASGDESAIPKLPPKERDRCRADPRAYRMRMMGLIRFMELIDQEFKRL